MKRLSCLAVLMAWAGAEEEVAQARQQAVQAFQEGNLEAFMPTWADNAVYTAPTVPFRLDGKAAIRDYFAD